MGFRDLKELKHKVDEAGGVLTVSMEDLRDAYGADRLGVNVRTRLQEQLAKLGLAHRPKDLPAYQEQQVRIYVQDSQVGELIRAATTLGSAADRRLREAANNRAVEILDKIRGMVS